MTPQTFAAFALVVLAGCASQTAQPSGPASIGGATYAAEIRRSAFGVPHIKAEDYGGIGFGVGYASAEDNICELADRMMTATASRARYLGPGAADANVVSDLYHQSLIQSGQLEALLNGPAGAPDTPSPDARALVRGFAAGVSRYIRDTGAANITDPRCKGAAWVREINETDYWRSVLAGQSPTQMAGVAGAAPPGAPGPQAAIADQPLPDATGLGSNALGLGKEVTKSGRGMLLGNPHYPWDGLNRFYRMHFTIPGKLNVVGAGLVNSPVIGIGHNQWIAWSHTVSTARRFGYFELKLDPANPTAYMFEGRSRPMTRLEVTVQVKTPSGLSPVARSFYATQFGPMVETATFPWTAERGFALRAAPQGIRSVDQYLAVWQARDVRELRAALGRYQATGFNTTAVDAGGETLFGDMGMIPHVTEALAQACSVSPLAKSQWTTSRTPVLDGSRAACEWGRDADASAPGVFGASKVPQLMRTDYVTQSNDSYWLTNPNQPLVGYSPVFGDEVTARSLRTRLGLKIVDARIAGSDGLAGRKFDLATLQQAMFNNRHLGGEMVRDDLVRACRGASNAKTAAACEVLARWDLRVDKESRGAHLFHLFAEAGGLRFKVPFNPADPVNTPNTLDVADPRVLAALATAVERLDGLGIPVDAPLGAVQNETRGTERIPIHGGAGPEGVFNVITVEDLQPQLGWTSVRTGSSWIMAVEFTPKGPVSQGVLTYSQSTNPNSPYHSDQTRLYSQKGWDDLRFTEAAVRAGTVKSITLSQPPRR